LAQSPFPAIARRALFVVDQQFDWDLQQLGLRQQDAGTVDVRWVAVNGSRRALRLILVRMVDADFFQVDFAGNLGTSEAIRGVGRQVVLARF